MSLPEVPMGACAPASKWRTPVAIFFFTLGAHFWLIARAGTDIPQADQWDTEGRWLYPSWLDGTWHWIDLFRPHNEHRITFTYSLDLLLLWLNGTWDPLVQLAVGAVLRAGCWTVTTWVFCRGMAAGQRRWMAAALIISGLPHLAWHNVLWGFQTQVWFALGCASLAAANMGEPVRPRASTMVGWTAVLAGPFAMAPGVLVSGAVSVWAFWSWISGGRESCQMRLKTTGLAAGLLLAIAWSIQPATPQHSAMHAQSVTEFASSLFRVLAWPHSEVPVAALVLNLPFAVFAVGRLIGRWKSEPGEGGVVILGLWAAGVAAALAWSRGGGEELQATIPSRYVDLLVLMPLVNLWSALRLVSRWGAAGKLCGRVVVAAWGVFVGVGWIGLSAETLEHIVLPRLRDQYAPARLAVAFQITNAPEVFTGQPRFYIPHSSLQTVRSVLADERLQGHLPPSFQPAQALGPLSRMVRWSMAHASGLASAAFVMGFLSFVGRGWRAAIPLRSSSART